MVILIDMQTPSCKNRPDSSTQETLPARGGSWYLCRADRRPASAPILDYRSAKHFPSRRDGATGKGLLLSCQSERFPVLMKQCRQLLRVCQIPRRGTSLIEVQQQLPCIRVTPAQFPHEGNNLQSCHK